MPRAVSHSRTLQLLLVLLVSAAVYLPFLGSRPLDNSEGHRVIPGWTMLRSGDWWHVEMFGLTYLRKPPGMPWAVAASSSVLDESVLAARLPSALAAILMALTAWAFATRWFGSPWGLAAGLGQTLMPLMWSPGRTAEIEMLNNLGTQWCALGLIAILLPLPEGGGRGVGSTRVDQPGVSTNTPAPPTHPQPLPLGWGPILAALGIILAALLKGPASVPVLIGVIAAACLVARSARPLLRPGMWAALLLAAAVLVPLGWKILKANSDPSGVYEDVTDKFLWSRERIIGVLTLLPAAWASALPVSLALLFALRSRNATARLLAWAWVFSILALILAGVSNPRYAMPAAAMLPPIAAWVMREAFAASSTLGARSRSLARAACLGKPSAWAALLLGVSAVLNWWLPAHPTEDQLAGPRVGQNLAGFISERRYDVWANDAVEARPDILWIAGIHNDRVRVLWKKHELSNTEEVPMHTFVLLRTDQGSDEFARYKPWIERGVLVERGSQRYRARSLEFGVFERAVIATQAIEDSPVPWTLTKE